MTGLRQAYYSDVVTDTNGHAVVGATVALYPTDLFPLGTHPTDPPTVAPTATALTDASGIFAVDGIPTGDYHLLVRYAVAGQAPHSVWRYNVAVMSYEETHRATTHNLASPLGHTLAKLLAGVPITIMCIGGETALGYGTTDPPNDGWVAGLARRLGDAAADATVVRYDPTGYATALDEPIASWAATTVRQSSAPPSQTLTIVNSSVTGDTVLRALRRSANFAWQPAPDCYIVQLGLAEAGTDPTCAVSPADFEGHLTGLVNTLRRNGADVVLCTPHLGPDPYAASVRAVAATLGCGLADIHALWQDHYGASAPNDGYGSWLATANGDHASPTSDGHNAIADEIYRLFDVARALPIVGPLATATERECVRLLNTHSAIQYAGSWTAHTGFTMSALLASPREMRASTPGDHLSVTVRGSDIYMLCRRWHDGGQLTVSVDGTNVGTVDLYRAGPVATSDIQDDDGAMAPQDRVPVALGLSDDDHTITITLAPPSNPASRGTVWRFDALEVVRLYQAGAAVEGSGPLQHIQSGSATLTLNAGASATTAVTFARPFTSDTPVVLAQSPHPAYHTAVGGVSATGATIALVRTDGTAVTDTQTVAWLALG